MPDPFRPALHAAAAAALLGAPLAAQAPPAQAPGQAPVQPAPEDPRALMIKARSLQLRGGGNDPRAAAALYRKAIDLVPQSAEAHLRLSEALQESGDLEAALAPAKRAVELNPACAEAAAHLGLLQYQRAQGALLNRPAHVQEAQQSLEKAAAMVPQDPEVWARLGEMAEGRDDKETALKAWLRLGHLRPSFTPAWERAVVLATSLKHYEPKREAVMALNAREPEPRHLRMLEELAREQVEAGYLAHAEESFLLLARYLPEEPALWENVALIRLRTQRFEDALASLKKAAALRESPLVTYNTALCLANLGRFDEALALLQGLQDAAAKAEAKSKDGAKLVWADGAQVLYGELLFLQGKDAELLAYLERTEPRERALAPARALRAQALLDQARWKEGLAALKEGLKAHPKESFFRLAASLPKPFLEPRLFGRKEARSALKQILLQSRAELLEEFRRHEEALEAVRQAKALGPVRDVGLLLLESNALDALGRGQASLAALREAQKRDPGNPLLQNNLGYLLLEMGGHQDEAVGLIEAAAKSTPDSGSVMDSLGWARFKQGRLEDAEKTLRQAVDLNPYSPESRRHLGEVLLKMGRGEEAAEQWERALAFVFPERRQLEKRLEDLRLNLARGQGRPAAPVAAPTRDAEDAE